jgi:hypothetical protein
MSAASMVEQKLLHKQYLTDELGNKTSIVLLMTEFQDLLEDIDDLVSLAADGGQTAKPGANNNRAISEQQIEQLNYYHGAFEKIALKLHEYKALKVELKKQLLLQDILTDLDTEMQRIRYQLAQLKKDTRPAVLHFVPELPANMLTVNNKLFTQLKQQLLLECKEARPPILLSAPVGMGKSVLAATLARDTAVRIAYPDGIFWLQIGKEPDILNRMLIILHGLDDKKPLFIDIEEAGEYIKRLTATRTCLVIFDDSIDPQDILPFNVLGEYGQMLITTSEENFFDILKYFLPNSQHFKLEEFATEQAIQFFIQKLGKADFKRENSPVKLESLVKLCQNSPSLLSYLAVVLKNRPNEWKEVIRELQSTEFEFPTKYPHILMQALFINVENLGERGEYYLSLSVFGDYTRIPITAIKVLWRYLYQMSNEEVEQFLAELAVRQMLYLRDGVKTVVLHSYQYDFVCSESELDKLHNHLLVAYRRLCGQHGWISGPNDGYFFQHLAMHLFNAKRVGELKSLLLDLDWIQKKLELTNLHQVLMDYEWLEGDDDVNMIREALHEGAQSLLVQKTQEVLASQILNYLWKKIPDDNKDLQAMLHQCKEAAPDWKWVEPFPEELMGSIR